MSCLRLAFQRRIFTDFVPESGLLLLGRGLGIDELVQSYIELYASPKLLVFVLNLSEALEADLLREYTAGEHELVGQVLFKVVDTNTAIARRQELYLAGGVISITARILLMDLLKSRIPTDLVTGVIVAEAHAVQEDGAEAFALELLRRANPLAFIKALSEHAEPFATGWAKPDKALKMLKVRQLFLHPRFDPDIDNELSAASVVANEYRQQATARMRSINIALADLVQKCLREIGKANPQIEMDDLKSTDLLATGELAGMIRRRLRTEWHRVSLKSRQLISELALLYAIESHLLAYDSVTFARFLETLVLASRITAAEDVDSAAFWLDDDIAQAMIETARGRVLRGTVEECPKWQCLQNIISEELQHEGDRVLVLVSDGSVKLQLQGMLHHGPSAYLSDQLAGFKAWRERGEFVTRSCMAGVDEQGRSRRFRAGALPPHIDPTQYILSVAAATSHEPINLAADEQPPDYEAELAKRGIFVRAYGDLLHPLCFLESLSPSSIIMYEIDLAFVRTIEVYKTIHGDSPLTLSMLFYHNTSEEVQYLVGIRREKEAFASLIASKPVKRTHNPFLLEPARHRG